MKSGSDRAVVEYAELIDMVLVTKNADFGDPALLVSDSARILRLVVGNCTTDQVAHVLRAAADDLPGLLDANRLVAIVRRQALRDPAPTRVSVAVS